MTDREPWTGFPDWRGETCALIASGESATLDAVQRLKGHCRVLVINTSYQRAPFADLLYACDARWWDWHNGAPDFAGVKITHDPEAAKRYGLKRIELLPQCDPDPHRIVTAPKGVVGRGDNGAFQGLNLLVQFGVRRILLLGVDFCGRRWHAPHPNGQQQSPQTLARWRVLFDVQANTLAALGVDVLNVSMVSALRAYPKMTIDEALAV